MGMNWRVEHAGRSGSCGTGLESREFSPLTMDDAQAAACECLTELEIE